jgi:N-dimethylarginine dimethylaminohydrolase
MTDCGWENPDRDPSPASNGARVRTKDLEMENEMLLSGATPLASPRAMSRREMAGLAVGLALAGCAGEAPARSTQGDGAARDETATSKVRVRDEHAQLRAAVVHDARNAIDVSREEIEDKVDPAILRAHPETGPVDRQMVIEQHGRFLDLLAQKGVNLIKPIAAYGTYCQLFTRDPSFVVGETLFIGAMRDDFRKPETDALCPVREAFGPALKLTGTNRLLEGGDVMVLDGGSVVLVGTHRHTITSGVLWLKEQLEPAGVQVVEVPHRALHLDTALAPLPGGRALFLPGKLSRAALERISPFFRGLEPIDHSEGLRRLAANLLWLDPDTVVSNAEAPRTNQSLTAAGFNVIPIQYDQVVSKWGSFRCVVCPLVRG